MPVAPRKHFPYLVGAFEPAQKNLFRTSRYFVWNISMHTEWYGASLLILVAYGLVTHYLISASLAPYFLGWVVAAAVVVVDLCMYLYSRFGTYYLEDIFVCVGLRKI